MVSIATVGGFLLIIWGLIWRFARRSPRIAVHCELESVEHVSAIGLPLWIKNESSIKQVVVRFKAQIKGKPESSVKISLHGRENRLPLELTPEEPEREFHILVSFGDPPPNDGVTRTLEVTCFCRWKGRETPSGTCEIRLVSR
jgi:hypothetical protein